MIWGCLVRKGYRNLSIPEELYLELERFLKDSKGRYVSVSEIVRVAIREFLDRQKQRRTI
jgi:Arc/MetJ-type ribon-helix-helix transcriptional regulator